MKLLKEKKKNRHLLEVTSLVSNVCF